MEKENKLSKDIEVRSDDSISDVPDGSCMICSSKRASEASFPSVDGKCAKCGAGICWSVDADPRITKVCRPCAVKDMRKTGGQLAVTETALSDVLQRLGLPDTPAVRETILANARKGLDDMLENPEPWGGGQEHEQE